MAKRSVLDLVRWKLVLAVALLLLALALTPPSARAATLTLTSDPDCVSRNSDSIDCFARGSDNAMWHATWTGGGGWSVWSSLGGGFHSGPSATSWGANRLDVFALGEDDRLWHIHWDGAAWSDWTSVGPKPGTNPSHLYFDPGCASYSSNTIECFVQGGGSAVGSHATWETACADSACDAGSWPVWASLGGPLYGGVPAVYDAFKSGPSAIADPVYRFVCAEGLDNALWCKRYSSTEWFDWQTRGGALTSGPACVGTVFSFYQGNIDCFVRGTDNAIWHMIQEANNNGVVSEYSLGRVWNSGPAVVSRDGKSYDVFAVGSDGGLYHNYESGNPESPWKGWEAVPMRVGQVLTATYIHLPTATATATTTASSAASSSTNAVMATDWAVLSVAFNPPDAQAGTSVTFSATITLLSSSVPPPQTVNLQCQLDSQPCGAGSITYPGPLGQPFTVHTQTLWVATLGTHTLTWSIATTNDPKPANNMMSLTFTVQPSTSQSVSSTTTQSSSTPTTQSSTQQLTVVQTQTVTQQPTTTPTTSQAVSQPGILDIFQQNSLLLIGVLGIAAIALAIALTGRGKHGSHTTPSR